MVNPKAPPLLALSIILGTDIFFNHLTRLGGALIGLFRALFDLRTEIQNWQERWQVWERGGGVRAWSTPGHPPPHPPPPTLTVLPHTSLTYNVSVLLYYFFLLILLTKLK